MNTYIIQIHFFKNLYENNAPQVQNEHFLPLEKESEELVGDILGISITFYSLKRYQENKANRSHWFNVCCMWISFLIFCYFYIFEIT